MIKFCKKSVHSLLNIASSTLLTSQQDSITSDHQQKSPAPGLIFLTNFDDVPKPNNVIESSSLINGTSRKIKEAIVSDISPSVKGDDICIRSTVLGGRDADRLAWCTESLGFESCTERSMSGEFEKYEKTRVKKKSKNLERKKEKNDRKMKVFPPALRSLNDNGRPIFALKPVRKDGRLQLTEVQVRRQESLHAIRENGRLRMYLVQQNYRNDLDDDDDIVDTEEKLGDTKDREVAEEDSKVPENRSTSGEDCRWLNDQMAGCSHDHQHENHNMHGDEWGQQSVTIR